MPSTGTALIIPTTIFKYARSGSRTLSDFEGLGSKTMEEITGQVRDGANGNLPDRASKSAQRTLENSQR